MRPKNAVWMYGDVWFDPTNPNPDAFEIPVICQSLAGIRRFCGRTSYPWSVAAHTIVLYRIVPEHLKQLALLHDVPEVITSDIPNPIKQLLPDVRKLEDSILDVVLAKFGVDKRDYPELKDWDRQLGDLEHKVLQVGELTDLPIDDWRTYCHEGNAAAELLLLMLKEFEHRIKQDD